MSGRWQETAACRGKDPNIFFALAAVNTKAAVREAEALAKAICATCPHTGIDGPCAAAGGYSPGIWGGLNPDERRKARALRATA